MKIWKRVRRFFQRRIPLLRKKKKDESVKNSEIFEELGENETSNQVVELAPQTSVQLRGSFEQISEEFKNCKEMAPSKNEIQQNQSEAASEGDQFPHKEDFGGSIDQEKMKGFSKTVMEMTPNADEVQENAEKSEYSEKLTTQQIMIMDDPLLSEQLENNIKNDNTNTPKREEFKDNKGEINNQGSQLLEGPFSPDGLQRNFKKEKKMTPSKDDFSEAKTDISIKRLPCPIEKYMLWDGPLVEGLDESLQKDKGEKADTSAFREDKNKKATENIQLPLEENDKLDVSWSSEECLQFEVDFESAFGTNVKTVDDGDPWYNASSMKVETSGRISKETPRQQPLKNDTTIDAQFDAAFEHAVNSYAEDSYDECYKEQKTSPNHYDFEEDCDEFSIEEKALTAVQKQKFRLDIRSCSIKNLASEKVFLYSDIENMMYLRNIRDPLKRRRDSVRSDLTAYKNIPFWESSNAKRCFSEGDLNKRLPDFARVFTQRKE